MSRAPIPDAHDRATVLAKGRRIAAGLAGEACDPGSGLPMAARVALAALALAVDVEASRRAGVEPVPEARQHLAEALAHVKAQAT